MLGSPYLWKVLNVLSNHLEHMKEMLHSDAKQPTTTTRAKHAGSEALAVDPCILGADHRTRIFIFGGRE